jgi:uncharacterized protein YidB (DUF937 family)
MGFLDDMASQAVGHFAGGSDNTLVHGVMELVQNQPGGISGLVQCFHEKGLGGIFESWVSTGQNLPISAEQIQGVLGNEQVQQLAAKAGISPEEASSKIAELLPGMVDKLSPDGKLPEGGELLQKAMGFFKAAS